MGKEYHYIPGISITKLNSVDYTITYSQHLTYTINPYYYDFSTNRLQTIIIYADNNSTQNSNILIHKSTVTPVNNEFTINYSLLTFGNWVFHAVTTTENIVPDYLIIGTASTKFTNALGNNSNASISLNSASILLEDASDNYGIATQKYDDDYKNYITSNGSLTDASNNYFVAVKTYDTNYAKYLITDGLLNEASTKYFQAVETYKTDVSDWFKVSGPIDSALTEYYSSVVDLSKASDYEYAKMEVEYLNKYITDITTLKNTATTFKTNIETDYTTLTTNINNLNTTVRSNNTLISNAKTSAGSMESFRINAISSVISQIQELSNKFYTFYNNVPDFTSKVEATLINSRNSGKGDGMAWARILDVDYYNTPYETYWPFAGIVVLNPKREYGWCFLDRVDIFKNFIDTLNGKPTVTTNDFNNIITHIKNYTNNISDFLTGTILVDLNSILSNDDGGSTQSWGNQAKVQLNILVFLLDDYLNSLYKIDVYNSVSTINSLANGAVYEKISSLINTINTINDIQPLTSNSPSLTDDISAIDYFIGDLTNLYNSANTNLSNTKQPILTNASNNKPSPYINIPQYKSNVENKKEKLNLAYSTALSTLSADLSNISDKRTALDIAFTTKGNDLTTLANNRNDINSKKQSLDNKKKEYDSALGLVIQDESNIRDKKKKLDIEYNNWAHALSDYNVKYSIMMDLSSNLDIAKIQEIQANLTAITASKISETSNIEYAVYNPNCLDDVINTIQKNYDPHFVNTIQKNYDPHFVNTKTIEPPNPNNPPNLWSRATLSCVNYDQAQLDMRRKAEVLKYKGNQNPLTKNQKWSRIVNGNGPLGKKVWATQNDLGSNPNVFNLEQVGNTLILCPNNDNYFAYVISGNNTVSGYRINPTTGALSLINDCPTGNQPEAVTVDPTGKFVYVANLLSNTVSAYTINPTTGELTPLPPPVIATGLNPQSVIVDPTGKFAYVANQGSTGVAGVSAYTIDQITGTLFNKNDYDTGDQPEAVTVDPTGKFAYVANGGSTGVAGVSAYTIDQITGALTRILPDTDTGFNPSAVTVDPTGKFAYVANGGSTGVAGVSAYTIDQNTGALSLINNYDTESTPSAVIVDPTGKFVYVANFLSNTVSAYMIDQITGALTNINDYFTGSEPSSVTVDPTGKFVYVTNDGSTGVAGVSAYTIDPITGALSGRIDYPSSLNPESIITTRILSNKKNIKCAPASSSDVPGNSILCYDPAVPLVNYLPPPRTYLAGGTKWPQSTWKPGDNGFPRGKKGMGMLFQ